MLNRLVGYSRVFRDNYRAIHFCHKTRTIAEALQEEEDVTFYTGLAQSLKRQFQEAFWKGENLKMHELCY